MSDASGSNVRNLPARDVGFGLDLGGTQWRCCCDGHTEAGKTDEWTSLEGLLDAIFATQKFIPAQLVLALPAAYKDGRLVFTNLDWPSVTERELEGRYGVGVEVINDMQAAQLGAQAIDRKQLNLLVGGKPHPSRHLTVLTLSTGVNWATGLRDGLLALAREQGHVRLVIPSETFAADYVAWLEEILDRAVSIEDALGGKSGVDRIVDYLVINTASKFNTDEWKLVLKQRYAGGDSAPLMAKLAKSVTFWEEVASIYGGLLGVVLGQIVVGELVGELVIQGSVFNGTPGFAKWLIEKTRLSEFLVSKGMKQAHVAEEVTIYGVPQDVHLGALGAESRAQAKLEV